MSASTAAAAAATALPAVASTASAALATSVAQMLAATAAAAAPNAADVHSVISPDFPLESTGFFPGKHLIQFLVLKTKDFRNFVLHNCILVLDAEQVYLHHQVTNLKNKEITVNPQPQTLGKKWFFENPIP